MELKKNIFRREVKKSDPETIRDIVTSTGFFNPEEIEIAAELADEFLTKGIESGYQFIFLDNDKHTMGYSCYGKIPGTKNSFALYWIAVHEKYRNQGLGKVILQETEKDIFAQEGVGIYVETSSRAQYVPTRMFYEKNGYQLKTRFEDYYDEGDDLVFYLKKEDLNPYKMFRIRKISNPYLPVNMKAIEQVKNLIDKQFGDIKKEKIDMITDQMINPLKYRFHAMLFVADSYTENIKGFALLLHMPDLHFYYLDYMAVAPGKTSSGVGGALYQRVREEAQSVHAKGIFLECLPDDPLLSKNPEILAQNKQRLAFYEKYGARPIINTKYEMPVVPGDNDPPYLVFDGLGYKEELSSDYVKQVMEAVLRRKYGDYCPESYIKEVRESIVDNPVLIRPFKYIKKKKDSVNIPSVEKPALYLVVNDKHDIHHIRERGYVEAPVRIKSILKEILPTGIFKIHEAEKYPDHFITAVHDPKYVSYFKTVVENIAEGKSVYPYVFPIRNNTKPPVELSVRAGYYCIDTFTPLNKNAYLAARSGVNCTLSAADAILQGTRAAYVLTRPPGHHAESNVFGGFCYFNNNAIAANYLSKYGKVAILDIDYHHGNGQQQIFYKRSDVLTLSIHGHPAFAYPYFSGFNNEKGEEEGLGYNINYALPETITPEKYHQTLNQALSSIKKFKPDYLVVALGLDTSKGDPTGTWPLKITDFTMNGKQIGALKLPTLFVQEGGYKTQVLGKNAKAFFSGFYDSIKTE